MQEEILKQVQRTRLFKHVASFLSHSCSGHTSFSSDVLTVLLLSLPSTTWDGITDEKLLREIRSLVSIENLPTLLQEEVLIIFSLFSKIKLNLIFFSFFPLVGGDNRSHYLI
jgi:hypothetical protein